MTVPLIYLLYHKYFEQTDDGKIGEEDKYVLHF